MATIEYDTATHTPLSNDDGSTSFPCPGCGKRTIYRTRKAREIVIKYTCPECGFTGPN
ncbi:MAG: zinc finger domain-containing protein [Candidatus Woesearchaeota archaeon]